ncbi:MAG: type II secretion system protein GspM [Myxococcota bacterium]|nr:type 4a pilus biogenesis protein PilO [Myxococcales bacterium]
MNELLVRLQTAWDDLSQRERLLLGTAGGLAALMLVWFVAVAPLLDLAGRASAGVVDAEQDLSSMKRLRREYDEVKARLGSVERRIQAKGQSRNILTLLESLAATSGVKVESLDPRQGASNEVYRETKVEVELSGVTLSQIVDYLHNIESSPQLLSVKSLRMKTRGEGGPDALLDVTFAVSSFEPL